MQESCIRRKMLRSLPWTRLRSVLPDADHPAAYQPTPFNLNRYVVLGIYMLCTLLSSCTYLGWGPLTAILFRNKAFIWVCSAEDQANDEGGSSNGGGAACTSQDIDVQNLFTMTYSVHFSATAIAGFLSDTAGPKVTATLGQTLNLCGWALLGACSDTFRAVLPSFVLIGAGAGMSYLPMLCIVHLFPGSTGFCLTIMGAACSLGLLVTLLMNLMNHSGLSFHWVMWNYAVLGPLLALALVVLFVPLNGFIEVDRFVIVRQVMSPIGSAASHRTINNNNENISNIDNTPSSFPSSPCQSSASYINQHVDDEDGRALSSVTDEDFFLPFRKEACTLLYLGLCIYFAICSVVINYYQKASGFLLSPKASKALNTALPLSIIPCLLLGRVSDYISIVWVMLFVDTSGALSILLAVMDKPGGISSVAFFTIFVGLFSSQVYIFIANLFTSSHFGKLSGLVNLLGGLASLSSNFFYGSNHDEAMWILFGATCIAFFVLLSMGFAAKKKQKKLRDAQIYKTPDAGNENSLIEESDYSATSTPEKKQSYSSDSISRQQSRSPPPSLDSQQPQSLDIETFHKKSITDPHDEQDRLSVSVPLYP